MMNSIFAAVLASAALALVPAAHAQEHGAPPASATPDALLIADAGSPDPAQLADAGTADAGPSGSASADADAGTHDAAPAPAAAATHEGAAAPADAHGGAAHEAAAGHEGGTEHAAGVGHDGAAEKSGAAGHDSATGHEAAGHDAASGHEAAAGHDAAGHGGGHDAGAAHGGAAHHGGPFELRFSLETPVYSHYAIDEFTGSTNFTESFELGFSVMLSYILVPHRVTLDLEVTESELFSSVFEEGTPKRAGTTVRLGGSFRPFLDEPLYLAALTTYHLEPSPFIFGLRLGAGVTIPITQSVQYFAELDLDLPLASSSGGPGAFQTQAVVIATGILWHLP